LSGRDGEKPNKALTGLKRPPFCMTTNKSLSELTAGSTGGSPKCPVFYAAVAHCANASFTCCTLRTTPPPLAGVRSHRELHPQSFAAARRMVDRGIYNLIDSVEQASDVLRVRGALNRTC